MADNKNKTGQQDRAAINPNEPYELQYWSNKWNVSEEKLKIAIKHTGSNNVKKLEEYIRQNTPSGQ